MNKKNSTLVILAAVMVCTMVIAGTLAYLKTATEAPVKNTFVAADGLINPNPTTDPTPTDPYDNNGLFVLEHEISVTTDGSYEIADKADIALGNDYRVLPGVKLPKDPFVRINGKNDIPAYLYIEVVDTLGKDSGLTYSISNSWLKLDGVTGEKGGQIYVYASGSNAIMVKEDVTDVAILSGNGITVADKLNIAENAELTFYAYLGQASAGKTATEVFTNCFAAKD